MSQKISLHLTGFALTTILLCAGCNIPGFKATATKKASGATGKTPIGLSVEAHNGSVKVVCEPELDEMQVEAEIVCRGNTQVEADQRLEKTELVVTSTGDNQWKVSVQFPNSRGNGEGASLVVRVPALDSAKLETSNGAVDLDASKAAVNGSVQVDTSNGSISVTRVSGNVKLDTSNGAIKVTDVGGKIDADSSNGKIDVTLLEGQQGPAVIKTSNASISFTVPKDFAGLIKADTSNASVKLDDPGKIAAKSNLSKSSGEVVMGSGETKSILDTSNGSIEIKIQP
ncbi:MAG: hypothetical protein U0930_19630 [Pirellulales bacterium]